MNMASTQLLSLSEQLVSAADKEEWDEVSRLQKTIHAALESTDVLKVYARKTLELVLDAINTAQQSTMQRRDEIHALVKILGE